MPTTPTKTTKSGRKSAEQRAAEDAAAQLEVAQEAMRAAQAAMEAARKAEAEAKAKAKREAEVKAKRGTKRKAEEERPTVPARGVFPRIGAGPVLMSYSIPCANCRGSEVACLWYTDTSQASSCARCQAYKKSCREGAPGKGVLLPKKRRHLEKYFSFRS